MNNIKKLSTKITQFISPYYNIFDLEYHPHVIRYIFLALIVWLFSLTMHLLYFDHNRTFSQDQARDILIAENFIEERQWLIGYGPKASVANFYLPPIYYYLQTLVHIVSPWPLSMSLFVAIIESFTPVVLFLIFARWIDDRSGAIAALVYSVSPLVLTFSTFMWNPNLIQFSVMLALFGTIEYVQTKKRRWILLTAIVLTLAFHLHYQSVVVMPFFVFTYLVMLWNRPKDWKFFVCGVAIFLLSFSTYFIVEMQNSFQNTREIIHYFQADHARIYEPVSKPEYVWKFIPQFFSRITMPYYLIGEGIRYGRWLFLIILPATLLFSSTTFLKKSPRSSERAKFLLMLYLLSVVIMLRAYKGEKVDYYMSTLFMAPAILLGMVFSHFRKVSLLLGLGFVVMYMNIMARFYVERFQVRYDNYNDLQTIFMFLNDRIGTSSAAFVSFSPDYDYSVRFGTKKWATFPTTSAELGRAEYIVQFCDENEECTAFQDQVCLGDKGLEKAGLRYDLNSVYNPQVAFTYGVYKVVLLQRMQ